MFGKLLKQEFRATGRIMLPMFAAMVLVSALANVSIRLLDRGLVNNLLLRILLIIVTVLYGVGIFGVFVVTLIMMVMRFHRNLLKDEGYLMHTLPVSVHGLVWSKMLVSLVWFLASALIAFLMVTITGMIQSGTSLGELIEMMNWERLQEVLAENGINWRTDLGVLAAEIFAVGMLGLFTTCLHFYAAMGLGYMFNKDKVLLSIVFYVVISIVLSVVSSLLGLRSVELVSVGAGSLPQAGLHLTQGYLLVAMGFEAVYALLLYLVTAVSLRRGLNLA